MRAAALVESGISPKDILCITFTNKAAQEMKLRLTHELGERAGEMYISTFHALCLNILRKFGKSIGYSPSMTVIDDSDQQQLMAQCARQLNYEISKQNVKNILYVCNDARENLLTGQAFDDHFHDNNDRIIASEYLKRLHKNNQIDFSGILSETVRLLESDSEIAQKLADRWQFMQVDESQDTNYAQFKIVELIGVHGNVFMVGDLDQSIYGWRGARYENITDFINNNNATVIELPTNYRSTPEIVGAASKLIKKNAGRETVSIDTPNPSGYPVICRDFDSPEKEAYWIASQIDRLCYEENYNYSDIAVLYRANAISRSIEQALTMKGVPYQVIGGFGFYDRMEVKDCLAMLRFAINPFDGTALSRFINKPARSIGEVTLGKIELYAQQNQISLVDALSKTSEYLAKVPKLKTVVANCRATAKSFSIDTKGKDIGNVLRELVTKMNYSEYLQKSFPDDHHEKQANIDELINAASMFSTRYGDDIVEFLNKIALMTSSDKSADGDQVSLMTIHASKGLEFPVVFIPRCEQGIIPHQRSINEGSLEEERRLMYVAMTRAEKVLAPSYAKYQNVNRGGHISTIRSSPSMFLYEANLIKD